MPRRWPGVACSHTPDPHSPTWVREKEAVTAAISFMRRSGVAGIESTQSRSLSGTGSTTDSSSTNGKEDPLDLQKGDRIELVEMGRERDGRSDPHPMEPGAKGTVMNVVPCSWGGEKFDH